MYSYIKEDNKGGKTAEGIKKNVRKKISNMKIIRKYYSRKNKFSMK